MTLDEHRRDPHMETILKKLGRALKDNMPHDCGFCLLLFSCAAEAPAGDEALFYVSSAPRADVLDVMKEFIKRNEH